MDFYKKHILSIITILCFISCIDDDAGRIIDNAPTTFEIIENSDEHTILEQVLIDTDLVEFLNSAVYTVFAPTDDAFSNIDLAGLTNEELRNILLNHFITGNVTATDLANAYYKTNAVETYSGENNVLDVYINVDGGIVLNGISEVEVEDLTANNGTVHVVDAVISIADLVTLTEANPNFSNLVIALTQEDLLDTLGTDADTPPAPFTLFAPDDNAFQNFLDEDDEDEFETIDDILNFPLLDEVLSYHVLSGSVRENEIEDNAVLTTLQGQTIKLNTGDTLTVTDQNNRVIPIKTTDVTGSNGVIHLIENILIPTIP
jgi:transforming growth factor-beta-induced protein